jgi:hypothetical protein
MQADQPGRAVRHLPGQPGPGLRHDRPGPLDRDGQLIQRPPQPAPHPAAQSPGHRPASVTQHCGGLRRGLVRQDGELTGHPVDHPGAFLPAELAAGPQLAGDLPDPPGRRPPPVRHRGARGPARGLHPPRRPHQLAHRPGQQPRVRRVGHIRRDHRRVGPHPGGAQQLRLRRLSQQRLVQPGHRRLPAPGSQLHQRRRMRHPAIPAGSGQTAARKSNR